MNGKKIRLVKEEDAEALLNIYRYYVEETAISFECETPSLEEFRQRIHRTLEKYPYLVAEKNGEIHGYCYLSDFVGRWAYRFCAETTIYVKHDCRKEGYGILLYNTLEKLAKEQNILNLNACIGYTEKPDSHLNNNSMDFHARMGYSQVGKFQDCGYKFNRWYSMIRMEKVIGKHLDTPPEFVPFPQLNAMTVEGYLFKE